MNKFEHLNVVNLFWLLIYSQDLCQYCTFIFVKSQIVTFFFVFRSLIIYFLVLWAPRWSKIASIKSGPNYVYLPVLLQQTSTLWSKVVKVSQKTLCFICNSKIWYRTILGERVLFFKATFKRIISMSFLPFHQMFSNAFRPLQSFWNPNQAFDLCSSLF